jgi:predicted ATPase/DNA-binding CsgD family transcriptional regulator
MAAQSSSIPFPAWDAVPEHGGIPVPPTRLLGRERELRQLSELVDRDDVRMVTLIGPGGVGKTRLALEVARELASSFAHGAMFVPLETIRDATLVPHVVGRALGLEERTDRPAADLLVDALALRHLLLVLDNLEQVIDAGVWLAKLISRCPRLKVVTTSRVPVNIGAEQVFRVAPLPVPTNDDRRTVAVDLFVERARAANIDVSIDEPALDAVAEICRRLDGLPLAIELAAARVSVLSPQALLGRLTHRLALLTDGRRDAPARLRSMRDAIGWSYELLTPEARRLLSRLWVFLGGFTLDPVAIAAERPATPAPDADGLGALQPLLEQSLVQPLGQGNEPRFRMLETIREYGLDAESGNDAGRAHAEYYLTQTEPAPRALMGPDQVAWLDRLEIEFPNLRQAVAWLAASGRLDDAIELVARIAFFLNLRGHGVETLGWLESWLGRPELAGPTRARGLALGVCGGLLQHTGPLERASAALGEAVDILAAIGDRWYEAQYRGIRGSVHAVMGNLEGMREHAAAALPLALEIGHHRGASTALSFLAEYALINGDADAARHLQDEARRTALDAGDVWLGAYRRVSLARDGMIAGRLDDAEKHASEALRLFAALGSLRDVPGMWDTLASIALLRGDLDLADERLSSGLQVIDRAGGVWDPTKLLETQGLIAIERGDLARAGQALAASLDGVDPVHELAHTCRSLTAYALLAARAGDVDNALVFLGAAVRTAQGGKFDPYHLPGEDIGPWLRSGLQSELGDAFRAVEGRDVPPVEDVMAMALAYSPSVAAPRPATPTFGLSPRELEVLLLMADGLSNQQISDALYVSLRTTATHVTSILAKLDMPSRTAAVAFAIRNGLA